MSTVNVNGNPRSQSLGLRLNDRKVFREYLNALPKVGSHYLLPLEANRIALLSEEQFEYLNPPSTVSPKKIFNATKNKQWNDEVTGRVTLLTLNEQALVVDRMITNLPSPKDIFNTISNSKKPIFRELSIISSAKDQIIGSAANFMANQAIQRIDAPEDDSSTEDTGGDIDPNDLGFNLNQLMRSSSSVVPNLNTTGKVAIKKNIVPQELQDYLDRFVIGNSHAKKVLSIAAHYHALRAVLNTGTGRSRKNQIQKSNVLMIGPTGSGKTLILSTLARKMEVPFVTVDATTYTQVGYHGNDPSKMIQELFNASEGDVEATKYGIVFIDEGDKLASRGSSQQSSSKRALQQSMLKIVEGTDVEVNSSGGKVSIDTSNILFIIGGAFVGLEDIIRERENAEDAALTEPLVRTGDIFARATEEDYEKFGLIPEFIGRFHQKTYLEKPSLEIFKSILRDSENSVLKQFQRLFAFDGNVLKITDDAIDTIAEEAMARVTGARALRTILNEILFDTIFQLDGRDGQILTVDIDADGNYEVNCDPNPDANAVIDMKGLSGQTIFGDYYLDRIREKPLKPQEIHEALNLEVIGNDHAKKTLSSAVYAHQRRIVYNYFAKNAEDQPEIEKSNVLLLGPTGSGKTLILNTLAKFLGVPFVSVDATTFSEAGYVGSDPQDMINQLYIQSGYDQKQTERGIIYIDEIDKLAMGLEGNRSEHQRAVQQAFLKMIEGTEVNTGGYFSSTKIDTSNILFICGGAFVGLEKLLEAGGVDVDKHSPFEEVLSDDIANFGLIPEFVGRLPALTHLQSPTEDTYKLILMKPKNSLFKQYKRLFKENQHNLSITDAAIDIIAHRAHRLATGARALRAVMDEILAEKMFKLPEMRPQNIVLDGDGAGGIDIRLTNMTDVEEPEVFELQVSSHDSKLESLKEHVPTPREIKAELDKNVIGNEQTKRVLATAINNHYTRTLHRLKNNNEPVIEKTNLLLLGPTGSGKTHVLKTLEHDLKVPMVIVTATDFTPVSYRGRDPEQAVIDLLSHCRDVEQCERGIIFIDEFDKLALGTGDPNRDEHNRAIQQGFLKLIEGTTVSAGRYTVDTSNILFICAGAFVGMEDILTDRGITIDKQKPFDAVDAVDIVSYNLIPEITGRIPTIIDLEAPSLETFKMMLLKTENSLLKQKKKELSVYGHELIFHESSVDRLAQLATERPTGARALKTVLDDALEDIMFTAPSLSPQKFIVRAVDKEFVIDQSNK